MDIHVIFLSNLHFFKLFFAKFLNFCLFIFSPASAFVPAAAAAKKGCCNANPRRTSAWKDVFMSELPSCSGNFSERQQSHEKGYGLPHVGKASYSPLSQANRH